MPSQSEDDAKLQKQPSVDIIGPDIDPAFLRRATDPVEKKAGRSGRPQRTLTDAEINLVQGLSVNQTRLSIIAALLGMTEKTFIACRERDPRVQQAIDLGRAQGVGMVNRASFNLAVSGKDSRHIQYWEQVHDGRRIRTVDDEIAKVIAVRKAEEITRAETAGRLPTPQEALAILEADPAMSDAVPVIPDIDEEA